MQGTGKTKAIINFKNTRVFSKGKGIVVESQLGVAVVTWS